MQQEEMRYFACTKNCMYTQSTVRRKGPIQCKIIIMKIKATKINLEKSEIFREKRVFLRCLITSSFHVFSTRSTNSENEHRPVGTVCARVTFNLIATVCVWVDGINSNFYCYYIFDCLHFLFVMRYILGERIIKIQLAKKRRKNCIGSTNCID
jgi:hypothetical protein